MPSSTAEITFTSTDKGVLALMERLDRSQDKLARNMDRLGRESKRSADASRDGWKKVGSTFKGVALSLVGGGSILTGLNLIKSAQADIIKQAEQIASKYEDSAKRFRVQTGYRGAEAGAAQARVENIAYANAVSLDTAFNAGTQLASSGFDRREASGDSLNAFLDVLAATNQSGEQVDSAELAKSLAGFLSSQNLELNAANVRRVGAGTQALFKGTNLQLSALTPLAKEGASLATALSPEETLASASVLLDQGIDESSTAVALRSIVSRLQTAKEGKAQDRGLEILGLKSGQVDFVGEDLDAVLGTLAEAFGRTDERDRAGAAKLLVGEAAVAPLLKLIESRGTVRDRVSLQSETGQFDADVREAQSGVNAAARRSEVREKVRGLENFNAEDLIGDALQRIEEERGVSALQASLNRGIYEAQRGAFISQGLAARSVYGDAAAQQARDLVAEDAGLDPADGRYRTFEELNSSLRELIRATRDETSERRRSNFAGPPSTALERGGAAAVIVQEGYSFGPPARHGRPSPSPDRVAFRPFAWFGLGGERHFTGPAQGRTLSVEACWEATLESSLRTLLAAVRAKQGVLTGDLQVQPVGGELVVYPQSTFVQLRFEVPRRDPHRGWFARGVLEWRQRFDLASLAGGN